jgi:hypothetical protein
MTLSSSVGVHMVDIVLLFAFLRSLSCVTEDGETAAATFACCEDKAAWTAGGMVVPDGRARPSAHRTRIVRRPVRAWGSGAIVHVDSSALSTALSVADEAFFRMPSDFSIVKG